MLTMEREKLGLEDLFSPLGPYPLKYEVGMGLSCVALRISLRKGKYDGHLHWYSKIKVLTVWANLFGSGFLVMVENIYSRDGGKFTETACPKRGPWFGKFLRGSKLRMAVTKRQVFGVTS